MGQYHVITNLSDRQGYSPSSVGSFLKLMELGHSPVALLPLFLLLQNEWHGKQIAIIGDYAMDADLSEEAKDAAGVPVEAIYALVTSNKEMNANGYRDANWKPWGWRARQLLEESGLGRSVEPRFGGYAFELTEDPTLADAVFVNLDKEEIVDPSGVGDSRSMGCWTVNSNFGGMGTIAAVLLGVSSTGGGRGGGDFNFDHPRVGSWGGDRLAVLPLHEVEGYTDITAEMRQVIEEGEEGAYVEVDGRIVSHGVPDSWG